MPFLDPSQPLTLAALTELLGADEPVRLAPEASLVGSAGAAAQPLAAAAPAEPAELAASLLLAYAAGTGPELPPALVRRLLLLKAYRLGRQPAGVPPALVRRLLDFFSRDVWPVVPTLGALGPETEQIPLAHLCLPLLGLGEVNYQGYRLAAADVLGLFGWEPLALQAQEGNALLHGGELTLAYATEALARATRLLAAAEAIGTLAAAGYGAASAGADPAFGSRAPALAAARAALAHASQAVATALNTVSVPPLLAADEELPGAHLEETTAPPLLGQLAQALAEVGALSARRTARLVAGGSGLPRYLATGPDQPFGLLALPQAAASLVAQNRSLGPATAFAERRAQAFGPLGAGAMSAATALRIVENTEQLLGLELLAAVQALDLRPPGASSPALATVAAAVAAFRAHATFVAAGQPLAPHLHRAAQFVREYAWA